MSRNKQSQLIAGFEEDFATQQEPKVVLRVKLDGRGAEIWRNLLAQGKLKGLHQEWILARALQAIELDMTRAIEAFRSPADSGKGKP